MQVYGRSLRRISASWTVSIVLIAVFTALYFVRTLLRADGKPFWYDELCTLYLSRLPSFGQSWAAQLNGIDYNPPLFHLIHRAFRAIFGDGQIALRLPEILSFWLFSICLFRFAQKRAGLAAGWIAMVLPMLTGAYYYATEARSYGVVLGFVGVALVCWQELQEEPHHWVWRAGFVTCMTGAYLNHDYAVLLVVPFVAAEVWRTIRTKELRWREWITLLVPAVLTALTYIPLIHSYRIEVAPTGYASQHAAKASQVADFYSFLLSPCWFIVAIAILVYVLKLRFPEIATRYKGAKPSLPEALVVVGLAAFPVFGFAFAFVARGPIFLRYFLPATTGCVLLVAFGCVYRQAARYVAILVAVLAIGNVLESIHLRRKGIEEHMTEISGPVAFARHIADPMEPYALVRSSPTGDLPIAVHTFTEFLYFIHYAPGLRSRLYPVSSTTTEQAYVLNRAFRRWCHVNFNQEQTFAQFIEHHHDFAFYGNKSDFPLVEQLFQNPDAVITSFKWGDDGHFLLTAHVSARSGVTARRSHMGG